MVKCAKCGTAWTSSGLPLCPVCGTREEEPFASSKTPKEDRRPDPELVIRCASLDSSGSKPSNGSAVLEVPPELRRSGSRIPVQLNAVDQAPVQDPNPEPYVFLIKEVEPTPESEPVSALVPTLNKASFMPESPLETRILRIPVAIDASAILPVQAGAKNLPAPARPMNSPLILGFLACLVPALILSITLALLSLEGPAGSLRVRPDGRRRASGTAPGSHSLGGRPAATADTPQRDGQRPDGEDR
jgi:hypothetical protein